MHQPVVKPNRGPRRRGDRYAQTGWMGDGKVHFVRDQRCWVVASGPTRTFPGSRPLEGRFVVGATHPDSHEDSR